MCMSQIWPDLVIVLFKRHLNFFSKQTTYLYWTCMDTIYCYFSFVSCLLSLIFWSYRCIVGHHQRHSSDLAISTKYHQNDPFCVHIFGDTSPTSLSTFHSQVCFGTLSLFLHSIWRPSMLAGKHGNVLGCVSMTDMTKEPKSSVTGSFGH